MLSTTAKPHRWLAKVVAMPIYSITAVFCVLCTIDLAAGRLQEDTCCRLSFFVEENASNSNEGCSSGWWVQKKHGDFQGFEVFYLVYKPKLHDSPFWKLTEMPEYYTLLVEYSRVLAAFPFTKKALVLQKQDPACSFSLS